MSFERYTRPGSELNLIAQNRQAQFDNQFFNNLYEMSQNDQLSYDFNGNVAYTGTGDSFPTLEKAWNVYRTRAKNSMMNANYAEFKAKYDQILQARNAKSIESIKKAELSGISPKRLKTLASKNSNFHKHIINMSMSNPELAAQLEQYLPDPKVSTLISENPGTAALLAGTGIAGTGALTGWLGEADADSMEKVNKAFRSERTAWSTANQAKIKELRRLRKNLEDAKKSAKFKKGGTANARIKTAQYRYDQALKPLKLDRKSIVKGTPETRWSKFMGARGVRGASMRGAAFMAGPAMIEKAVGGFSGNEKLGELAGVSSQAALGVKFSIDSLKRMFNKHSPGKVLSFLARRAPGLALKFGIKIGATTATAGTGFGAPLAAIMAGWTARDLYQIMTILQELE